MRRSPRSRWKRLWRMRRRGRGPASPFPRFWSERMELTDLSMLELSAQLDAGRLSSQEATEACLTRIREVDPKVRAFLHIDEEGVRSQARESDRRRKAAQLRGPL